MRWSSRVSKLLPSPHNHGIAAGAEGCAQAAYAAASCATIAVIEPVCTANHPEREVGLDGIELRFAATRVDDERAVRRLMQSIEACGQLIACIAVDPGASEAAPLVLIDGYRRVAALRRLARDTVRVECWNCSLGAALAQVLARSRSRAFTALEEALLLRELMDGQRLSQREAARQSGRDASWVQRRLQLLGELPEGLLEAVRTGQVSTWAATRVFAPLARANADHAQRLLARGTKPRQGLSTRELASWFAHYQRAQRREREHMVDHPRLLLDSLAERDSQRAAAQLENGPEGAAVGELGRLQGLLEVARKHLAGLQRPVSVPLLHACRRVRVRCRELEGEFGRLIDDADGDPQHGVRAATPGPFAARDQPAAAHLA
jgi:ParB-like chromosome segregation protein Spo0J